MRSDTTPLMIAQTLLVDYCERYSASILKAIDGAALREGEPNFTVILKNGKSYRISVAEVE